MWKAHEQDSIEPQEQLSAIGRRVWLSFEAVAAEIDQ